MAEQSRPSDGAAARPHHEHSAAPCCPAVRRTFTQELHARFEPLLLFFIDGASLIEMDEKWEVLLAWQQPMEDASRPPLLVRRGGRPHAALAGLLQAGRCVDEPSGHPERATPAAACRAPPGRRLKRERRRCCHAPVRVRVQMGLTTLYNFWAYPDASRLRLSQILVLPPYRCEALLGSCCGAGLETPRCGGFLVGRCSAPRRRGVKRGQRACDAACLPLTGSWAWARPCSPCRTAWPASATASTSR